MLKYILLGSMLFIGSTLLISQSNEVAMNSSLWDYNEETMTFTDHNGIPVLHISGDGIATINDVVFQSGTIEFDYYAKGRGFCGIYFRRQQGANSSPELNSEFFYMRSFKIDNPILPGSVQYAPIIRGTNLWDLLHDYEANALIKSETWNRVKLIISNEQMKVFLNDNLVLWIPELLGPSQPGIISLEGAGMYANMKIDNQSSTEIPDSKGADVTAHDVRYLRDWQYSPSYELLNTTAITKEMLPDSNTVWSPISAGRFGLINLTKEISSPFIEKKREMVWLTTTIESSYNQTKRLNLGFSDDISVYVNGKLVHIDKNTFGSSMAKQPNGRLHIDNALINVPIVKGENKITIALANDFFGWGLVARLDNMRGIVNKMKN